MSEQLVAITVTLTDVQAMAYAQFLKRVGWSEFRANACDQAEAYLIRTASETIRESLAEKGYAPR